MNCPHCQDARLVMSDRQGVEIDYCPQCRGVWLDRGELDKLIERSAAMASTGEARMSGAQSQRRPDFADTEAGYRNGHRRPKSWLSEIFD